MSGTLGTSGSPSIDMHNDPVHYRDGDLPDSLSPPSVPFTPFALRSSRIGDIRTRSDLIRELTKQIPVNEYGLPNYYYRPDMLDTQTLCASMLRSDVTFVNEMLQTAIIPITYGQGFPTLESHEPIWAQLPFESKEAHHAFLQYADQRGIRNLADLTFEMPELIGEYFNLNYWFSRAKALDMFRAAHHARLREHRIMDLEDNHFVEGEKIVKRLQAAIANKSEADLAEMDVDKLISALEKVSKIQRAAVGLSTGAAGSAGEVPKASSVEVIMRSVAEGEKQTIEATDFDVSFLQDPELVQKAQELIIRVNK